MWKKKKYIKPITEVIIVDIRCQMLSRSDGILHHSDTQTDTPGPGFGATNMVMETLKLPK